MRRARSGLGQIIDTDAKCTTTASVVATFGKPSAVLLSKEIGNPASRHNLQPRSSAMCALLPPLLIDWPRTGPCGHVRSISPDDENNR